ncbi:MAG: LppX_LprAFG lipoprotein [Dehalococcoidia bacterium]
MTVRQQGSRPARRGLTAVALLLAVLLASCGGGDDPPAQDLPEATTVLEESATRMEQLRSMHFLLEHQDGATEIVRGIAMTRAEGDVVTPDKMQATVKGGLGPVNFEIGIVILGDEAWIQNPLNRRWESEDITIDQVFDPREGVIALVRSTRDASVTGTDEVAGVDCYRLEATLDSGDLDLLPGDPAPGKAVPTVAWVGVDDDLVYKVELQGAVAEGESEDLVRTLTLSRFDEDISIVPPR